MGKTEGAKSGEIMERPVKVKVLLAIQWRSQ
jgi:hypothetical protein